MDFIQYKLRVFSFLKGLRRGRLTKSSNYFNHLGQSASLNILFLQNAASANRISCPLLYKQELLYSPTAIPFALEQAQNSVQLSHGVLEEKEGAYYCIMKTIHTVLQLAYYSGGGGRNLECFPILITKDTTNIPSGQFLYLHFMTIFLFVN